MSTLASVLAVLVLLLAGSYLVAVLDRLFAYGPRRLGLAVALPITEAFTLLHREDLTPRGPDFLLFRSAPIVALACVALAALVIPLGPEWIGFDPAIGVFYFIVVLGPFSVVMMNAGWSQNAKSGLFGAFRAAAYLIAYEVPLGFAAIGPVMAAESLSTTRIVEAQAGLWYAVWQPLGLAIYIPAALFLAYRHPFDIPQAGSELTGGVLAEYSGARLLVFRIALDGIFLVLMAMGVVLFFGGWLGPLLPPPVWLILKTFALAALVLWGSRYLPRLRHDQMLSFAWKILLPASLVNVALVGILILILPGGGS